MASPRNTVSGLDINRTSICYSRYLSEDRMVINICIQPLDTDAVDYWQSVSEGFDEFLKEFKIPGENVVSSLPGEYAIIKKIALESDETEVEDTIEWELSQQIIGSIDEYVYDYQNVNAAPVDNFQQYLVVGYRNTAVTKLSKLLRAKKLNPVVIDLDVFALINVFEMNYADQINVPSLIMFSDEIKTKLILTIQGNFIDIDIIDHTEEMQTPKGYIQILNPVINKLCAHNTGFPKPDAVRTYLTGSYFSQPENVEAVMGALKHAEILYPFRNISCAAGMDENQLKEFAPLLTVSVGLASRDIG